MQPSAVDPTILNNLLLSYLASKMTPMGKSSTRERANVLTWGCRLIEENRFDCLRVLLDAVLSYLLEGKPFPSLFESPPSHEVLPTISRLSAVSEERNFMTDIDWAKDLVARCSEATSPSSFFDSQPRPRTGSVCYLGIFSNP